MSSSTSNPVNSLASCRIRSTSSDAFLVPTALPPTPLLPTSKSLVVTPPVTSTPWAASRFFFRSAIDRSSSGILSASNVAPPATPEASPAVPSPPAPPVFAASIVSIM